MTARALCATLGLAACGGGAASIPAAPTGPAARAEVHPIINYEYAIVNISQGSASRAQDLRAFLDWAITTGTAQLAQVNFQPLPPSVVTLSQAQIAKIRG